MHLTATAVNKAKRDATAGPVSEIQDEGCRGLVLRLQPTGCVWQSRLHHNGKAHRVKIGPVDIWTLAWARETHRQVQWHITSGHGVPDPYWFGLQLQHHKWLEARRDFDEETHRAMKPVGPAVMTKPERPKTWTYAQACDAWLAHLRAEKDAELLTAPTVENYRKIIRSPAMRTLDGKYVARLEPADVAAVVQGLVAESKRSTANDVTRVGKRFWTWLGEPGQELFSGVKPEAMKRLKAPNLGNVKGRQQFPRMPELAMMMATVRSGALKPTMSAAVELLLWTAQRRLSIVKAKCEEFTDWPENEGWGVWRAGHRKTPRANSTGQPHAIPLPPAAWSRMKAYLHTLPQGTEWAFPQQRSRRVDDATILTHIGADSLSHTIRALPGSLSSAHDIRRGMATALQDLAGQHVALVAMILDHAADATTRDSNGMTRRYTEAELLGFKMPVMAAWEALLEPAASAVVLPPASDLKRELVERRAEQRGVVLAADHARLKAINKAKAARAKADRLASLARSDEGPGSRQHT